MTQKRDSVMLQQESYSTLCAIALEDYLNNKQVRFFTVKMGHGIKLMISKVDFDRYLPDIINQYRQGCSIELIDHLMAVRNGWEGINPTGYIVFNKKTKELYLLSKDGFSLSFKEKLEELY